MKCWTVSIFALLVVIIFDCIDILRIDRVFRQPQGHVLLIGVSGGGKTVLSRFVAWMNGLSIFTIKVNNKYAAQDFDEDLRHVMKVFTCTRIFGSVLIIFAASWLQGREAVFHFR